ncbi:hypothetical protein CSC12_4843 [Klebsiella michiganensis]|nr:hypothetical protein CSC12_4843 [Klebsiella michiganensis]
MLDSPLSQLRLLYKCRAVHNLKKLTRKKAKRRMQSKMDKKCELTTSRMNPAK